MSIFVMLPLKVFHCHKLTRTDIFVWMAFREKETLPGWVHCTKEISNRIGIGHGTVLKCIRNLCDAGYLRREPKNNGDFGYIYSIPNEYLCLDGDDLANYSKEKKRPVQMSGRHAKKRLEREVRKNFAQNSETTVNTATAKTAVVKTATNNNINNNHIDHNNIDHQSNSETCDENATDELMMMSDDIFFEEEKPEYLEATEEESPLTIKNETIEPPITDLKEDTFSEGVSHENKQSESQNEEKVIDVVASEVKEGDKGIQVDPLREKLKDVEFLKFVMAKYPKVSNHVGYCLTPDKATGERIGDILLREFMGGQSGSNGSVNAPQSKVYSYVSNGMIPYGEMAWQEDLLPGEFDKWCNRLRGAKSDSNFIEDNAIGYSRNVRIAFCRWYEYFYAPKQMENGGNEPPVNERGLSAIRDFLAKFNGRGQSFA